MQFDDFIQASLDKWPNVPTLYGWLSLTRDGQWRLHPKTHILNVDTHKQEAGESISSPGLIRFLNQYYFVDEDGAWFFQNGPQRVYVALSAAPWILHLDTDNSARLITHTVQTIERIDTWYFDEEGLLYAQTDKGFALIHRRDINALITYLEITEAQLEGLFEQITQLQEMLALDKHMVSEPIATTIKKVHHPIYGDAPLLLLPSKDREKVGQFVAYPNRPVI